jgi:DnaK suppressor protein
MPESEYMNEKQLEFFRAQLQKQKDDLLSNAGETTEHLRETVLVPDPADRATIEEAHALELRTRDRERKLLKKVQQSIAAIDAGEYGWCEETGEPIGIPRLIARPTATLSLEAQQRRELKQKLYGD